MAALLDKSFLDVSLGVGACAFSSMMLQRVSFSIAEIETVNQENLALASA